MNKTAVDFLFDELKKYIKSGDDSDSAFFVFALAKQKEREQVVDAYKNGRADELLNVQLSAHQYYQAKYGGKDA
jgi:hypothetical protein